jgi:hypothetical protein
MPRVAVVTRVSTEEQTRGDYTSCESQRDVCEHYVEVKRDRGWEIYRVYEDAGYTGRNLKRPGIRALLRDVRRDLIDIVLCTRIDRVSRSIKDFYSLWSVFEEHDVTFVSATESFDTSSLQVIAAALKQPASRVSGLLDVVDEGVDSTELQIEISVDIWVMHDVRVVVGVGLFRLLIVVWRHW